MIPLSSSAAPPSGGDAVEQIDALEKVVFDVKQSVEMMEQRLVELLANPVFSLEGHVRLEPGPLQGLRGPHVVIEGANLHVRSGSSATDDGGTPLGLGNLVIGYDADTEADDTRSGSHNLVVGDEHGFSSTGGVLAGFDHDVSALGGVALGGRSHRVSGVASVALGGLEHTVAGDVALAAGGEAASATALSTTIVGGAAHGASEIAASVFGGSGNQASGVGAVASGGRGNTASGQESAVRGGRANEASGRLSSVSGGDGRSAGAPLDWVAGALFQDF
jgi:hypothetical protein